MDVKINETVNVIVRALSVGDVQSLVGKKLLNADEADGTLEVIHQYGRNLTDIPLEGWSLIDVYSINQQKEVYDMDIPLWTAEEGRSDLMLQVHVDHGIVKILSVLVP
jgi:hypothetical protein